MSNPNVKPDTSAWLDQVESARHTLLQTLRSHRLIGEASLCADTIDLLVQEAMDDVIDAETAP